MPRKYITQYINGKGRTTALHKFIDITGRNYSTLTRSEIDKVGDLKQYKQWKKLHRIQNMLKKQHKLKEDGPPIQFSKRYKHTDHHHITKKKLITTLLGMGFSPEKQATTATKQTKFGKARVRVGKRAYVAIRPGYAKFRQISFDPQKKGKTKTIRLLKKHREYVGKIVPKIISSDYEYEVKNINTLVENQPMSYDEKIDKTQPENKISTLVSKNKKLKGQDQEFKISKTITGKSGADTDSILINPTQNSDLIKK